MAEDYAKKLQSLLRKLFQFESADLDFGIYRIMNKKRDVIQQFIDKDLIAAVEAEFGKVSEVTKASVQKEIDELKITIQKTLGSSALLPSGDFNPKFIDTPIGADLAKQYKERVAAYNAASVSDEHKAEIFNHIYQFFSRYYDNGDFMSMRRYSAKQKFAVPYNGEEVLFHWANKDQYYIKTGEYFFNYAFRVGEYTVQFQIVQAETSVNNTKGKDRFFVLASGEGNVTYDAKKKELIVLFEYRALTESEKATLGSRNIQDALNEQARGAILAAISDAGLKSGLTREVEGKSPLAKHLATYARRNTTDYFIHKDLGGFLRQELDFYIKNEMFDLDDLGTDKEVPIEQYLNRVRVMKAISLKIIDFLAQIEDFQKKLWEKKKFVTETFYVITVSNIPEAFYPEIAACKAQWEEWKALFHIDDEQADLFTAGKSKEEQRLAFLKARPTLVLDTRHFPQDFVDRLLASFDSLDEMIDGLLVHGENWQALNLLQEKYRERVNCIYIDPPFNSPSTEILYKNDYPHSSWLTLMENRITLTRRHLKEGVYIIAIDENEQERLGMLLRSSWLSDYKIVCVSVRHNPRGIQGMNFSHCHEYAYFVYPSDERKYIGETQRDKIDARNLRDSGTESERTDARNCFYPIITDGRQVVGFGEVAPDDYHPAGSNERLECGKVAVWPIDTSGREKKWRYARQSIEKILPNLQVRMIRGKYEIYFAKDVGTVRTIWDDAKFDASEYGTKVLQQIFGAKDVGFSFPKSLYTLIETIRITSFKGESLILDYFAGSGTTGHAVINLNREDGGRRKFILVEVADYFDTVLLPRIKKVTFTPEWKDGKPKRMATPEEAARGPRIAKVIRLESYEDTLNNIEFKEAGTVQKTLMDMDGYFLRYMLDFETRESPCRMNVAKLERPFEYTLRISRDNQLHNETVDLVETFNYLLGLKVKRIRAFKENGITYRVVHGETLAGQSTTVIWRTTVGLDLKKDKQYIEDILLKDPKLKAERVYINGDFHIEGALNIEPEFQRLMGA